MNALLKAKVCQAILGTIKAIEKIVNVTMDICVASYLIVMAIVTCVVVFLMLFSVVSAPVHFFSLLNPGSGVSPRDFNFLTTIENRLTQFFTSIPNSVGYFVLALIIVFLIAAIFSKPLGKLYGKMMASLQRNAKAVI